MRTSSQLHAWIDNGKPQGKLYTTPDELGGRGWYDREVNYTQASVFHPPAEPVSGIWRVQVSLKRGHEGIPVTSHRVAIDPRIHAGDKGIVIKEGTGAFEGAIEIDTTKLSNGPHKLGLLANAVFQEDGSENSCHFVFNFVVDNGPDDVMSWFGAN